MKQTITNAKLYKLFQLLKKIYNICQLLFIHFTLPFVSSLKTSILVL